MRAVYCIVKHSNCVSSRCCDIVILSGRVVVDIQAREPPTHIPETPAPGGAHLTFRLSLLQIYEAHYQASRISAAPSSRNVVDNVYNTLIVSALLVTGSWSD